MTSLSAKQALDAYFLEARCRLLDLAAILDRIARGADAAAVAPDPRLATIQQALKLLQEPHSHRAEQIQTLFSLAYDPNWPRPEPKECPPGPVVRPLPR
jgi:hypothetical protein